MARILVPGKAVKATSPESAAIFRGLPLHNAAASAQAAHVGFGGVYFRGVGVVSAQATKVVRGLSVSMSAVHTQAVSHVKTVIVVARGVASAATSLLVKTVGHLVMVLSPDVAAVVRSTVLPRGTTDAAAAALAATAARSRSFGAVSAQIAAALAQHARPLVALAASAQQAALTRLNTLSHLLPLGVASAQAFSVVRGISHAGAAVTAAAQACVRAIGHVLSAISAQAVALVAPGLHYVLALVASAQVVLERGSQILVRGIASAQHAFAIESGRLAHVTALATSTSAAALRRLILKLIGLGAPQVPSVGRIEFKIVGTTQGQVAARFVPKGLRLGASHTLRARVVTWFHLFVPDWAYQQTTLLPPHGGPAEPPSFGPIDPADQTTFAFDWSSRANFNDPIVSATVVSVPSGMTFLGPVFTGGTLVEVTALPFTPPQVPATYALRCTCVFASGRRSSFSIPVPIRNL